MTYLDMRNRMSGSLVRPTLRSQDTLVVHNFAVEKVRIPMRAHGWKIPDDEDPFETLENFFTLDAEGVSTVTERGKYHERRPTFMRWYREGVPISNLQRAHVPYHDAIDSTGRRAQFLDYDREGAHAGGSTNKHSISVALLGDFSEYPPTGKAMMRLKYLMRDHLVRNPRLQVATHDDVLSRAKGCPGKVPVARKPGGGPRLRQRPSGRGRHVAETSS